MAKSPTSAERAINFRSLTSSDEGFCRRLSDAVRDELEDGQQFITFVFTPQVDAKCSITVLGDVCPTFAGDWITRYFEQMRARGLQ